MQIRITQCFSKLFTDKLMICVGNEATYFLNHGNNSSYVTTTFFPRCILRKQPGLHYLPSVLLLIKKNNNFLCIKICLNTTFVINRNSRFKIGVLKNIAIFTGKHLCLA